MRRLSAVLLLVLAVAGAGLWVGPRFVDWEAWRGRLQDLASERLGRPVALSGDIELSLLPQPELRAAGVAIGEPGDAFAFTAHALRVRLDLAALIGGRWEPREVALVRPELTLPWPPGTLLALRPPTWITELDALIENGRIRIGDTVLEGVGARLTSGGAAQALELAGGFTWAGRTGRFTASLGRPGWDGVTTFDLTVALPEAEGTARGVLTPTAGFDGTVTMSGRDLAALLPAPPGPFRASGRLTATAELLAADELAIEIGGAPARGAVAIRLLPAPRLDVALIASRIDLDGWAAALRGAAPRPWPLSIDLSAEAAMFRGLTLRRLRGAAFLDDGRLALSDVSVLLPGETQLDISGATAGDRLEVQGRFSGEDLRTTALAFGLPVANVDPVLLRAGEGRFRAALEAGQVTVPEFAAVLEGFRLSGAGVLRHGPRPSLGLGLAMDRLDLARWFPSGMQPADAARLFTGLDLNLRLTAERATHGALVLDRAALDAAVEGGRLTLRRLSGRMAETDIATSFALILAPQWRLADLSLEANGPAARGLLALLPSPWPGDTPLARQPLALRLAGGGPADALALRGTVDIGELRLEAQGTLDLPGTRGTASLTLRHPGAPRLLAEVFGAGTGAWLGEGSLSLIATLAGGLPSLTAESFELVAGGLRARGGATYTSGPRPRLHGRLQAERLPIAFPGWRSAEPLPLTALAGLDAELALEAGRVEIGGAALEQAAGTLHLAEGRLRLEDVRARLHGGNLTGAIGVEALPGTTPRLSVQAKLAGATLAAPLFGLPFDIGAGLVDAEIAVAGTGFAPAALVASMQGDLRASLRAGVLAGFDLAGAAEATLGSDALEAEALMRRALTGGATAVERADLVARIQTGRLVLQDARIAVEGGVAATAAGEVDLARGALDLRLALRPPAEGAPELGLRLTGPADIPRPLPETAAWARWRAQGR
jgi:hypothetical protein